MIPKLQLIDVRKSFGSRVVLDGVSIDVADREVVAFVGASGSGKSTLLRCVNLLEPIDDGQVVVDDVDISVPGLPVDPIRRRIGMVFQSFNLFPHMNVLKNLSLAPRKVLGVSRSEAENTARELLERLGLGDRADAYPDQLSGGQQQRVAIARSLAMSPEILLLDEITSALDPELVGEVLDVVRELKGGGMTMLIVTHEMAFAREIADRVCFLHQGQIAEMAPPDKFFSSPENERTRQFLQRVIESGRF
ncbi:MAG: peptide ABC transporter ATP-binding protein [Acidimicrobiales bacterium mtb01]|nr:amino acid ABC transporter ATP-binding protein [Actinomycetota bacterium]TEX44860.1 MAG: peptide ABC transporter ATP-binding protein [Acidimicrobiales bacterium mtb01]